MLVSAMPQDANDSMLLLVGPNGSPATLDEMSASSVIRVVCADTVAEAAMKIIASTKKTRKFDISVSVGISSNDLEKASSLANTSGVIVALWGSGFGASDKASVRCVSYASTDDLERVQMVSKQFLVMPVDIMTIIPGAIIGKGGKERVLYVLSCSSGLFLHPSSNNNAELENALVKAAASTLWENDPDALALTNYILKESPTNIKMVPILEKTLEEANQKVGFTDAMNG